MPHNFSAASVLELAEKMLITRYSNLLKKNPQGTWDVFHAARAMGLSLEVGWDVAMQVGLLDVEEQHLDTLTVLGTLLKSVDGKSWLSAGQRRVKLTEPDAKCSMEVLKQQASFLSSLGVSICCCQRRLGRGLLTLDLLGFFAKTGHGIKGRVWIETVVFSVKNFAKSSGDELQKIEDTFARVQGQDPTIKGAILLAAEIQRDGPRNWQLTVSLGSPSLGGKSSSEGVV